MKRNSWLTLTFVWATTTPGSTYRKLPEGDVGSVDRLPRNTFTVPATNRG